MGWGQPFHFQVDPLNLRLMWRLQPRALGDEPLDVSLEAAAPGRAGAGTSRKIDTWRAREQRTSVQCCGQQQKAISDRGKAGKTRFQTGGNGQNQISEQGKQSSFPGEFNLP